MDADTIMRRLNELEEENKRLRSLLAEHGIPFEACVHDGNLAVPPIFKANVFFRKPFFAGKSWIVPEPIQRS